MKSDKTCYNKFIAISIVRCMCFSPVLIVGFILVRAGIHEHRIYNNTRYSQLEALPASHNMKKVVGRIDHIFQ